MICLRPRMFALLFALLLLILTNRLDAQIVNMQSALSGNIAEGPGAMVEGRQEKRIGNTNIERLTGHATLTYKNPQDLWLFTIRRDYAKDNGLSSADNRFYHLRYRYMFHENWSWEAYGQEDSDRFRRSKSRTVIGSGPRFQYSPSEKFQFALGVAYMYEKEIYFEDSNLPVSDRITRRISNVLFLSYKLSDWGDLANVLYFQPEIGHLNNHRTLNESSLALRINAYLNYKLTYTYAFNHRPPSGIKNDDESFIQSLLLKI